MKIITSDFLIQPEPVGSAGAVEILYDRVFGPARLQKASHGFRTGVAALRAFSWIAKDGDRMVGAIRYWPIVIGEARHPALLLGPLAVLPERAGCGIGSALVGKTLALAKQAGHDLVLLVGDVDYYERFGFVPATPHGFVMPGEKRPERLQVIALQDGILGRVAGALHRRDAEQPGLAWPAAAAFGA
jgi:predicted N-acetyltransferase YhbS